MTHEVAFEAAHPQRMLRTVAADDVVPFALGAIPIIALGFANGGFYAKSWSWATLGLAVALVVGCAAARPSAWPRPLAFLAILGALGAWIILSSLWSRSASLTVPEAQRVLLYIVGVASAALIVRAARWRFLFLGVTSGLSFVVVWGLVSYLLGRESPPAQFEGYLLHAPMGYANAMAIATVMAIVAVLGFATNGALPAVRFGSALLLVPLTSALALTGSRAAWGALIVGCLVAVASSPGPWGTLRAWSVLLTIPAVAALVVSLADLDDASTVGKRADHVGEIVLGFVAALTAIGAIPALRVTRRSGGSRVVDVRTVKVSAAVMGTALCLAVGVLLIARPGALGGDRPTYWRVAFEEAAEHPALGVGAGTYHQVWLERRPNPTSVRDAHSIVIEALAELGIVGVVLVVLVVGAPFLWGARIREQPLVPAALGTLAAFSAHALVDWDWEIPAVTLAALFVGASLAFAADSATSGGPLTRPTRAIVGVLGVATCLVAVAGYIGASQIEVAQRALSRGDVVRAERSARRAERWQPWSVEPLLTAGRAQLASSRPDAARTSFARAVKRDPNDYRAWLGLAAVSDGDARTLAVLRARALNPRAVVDYR